MKTVSLRAYRIADKIDLTLVAGLLGRKVKRTIRHLHIVDSPDIKISGLDDESAGIYLYSNGCAVFHGMGESDTRDFITFLETQEVVKVEWHAFARFAEEMEVEISEDTECKLLIERGKACLPHMDRLCIEAFATALARSVRLAAGIERVEEMYGKSELLLERMRQQKGALSKVHMKGLSEFLRLLKDSEYVAPPEGTPAFLRRTGLCEEVYEKAAIVYRLEDRYKAICERNIHMRKTLKQYATLIHRREEIKAYVIEVILIGSFLIMDFFYYF